MYSRVGIMGLDPYQIVFKICWSRLEHCLMFMHRVLVWLMIRFNCICIIENACSCCIVLSQAFLSFVNSYHYMFEILLIINIKQQISATGLESNCPASWAPIPHVLCGKQKLNQGLRKPQWSLFFIEIQNFWAP